MGLLSDFVVRPEADAMTVCQSLNPASDFDGVSYKNITIVELSKLQSILSGRTFSAVLPEYKNLASASDEGPWVCKVSDELTQSLARLTEDGLIDAAARWAATEEVQSMDWGEEATVETLRSICEMARKVVPGKTALLLWNCL